MNHLGDPPKDFRHLNLSFWLLSSFILSHAKHYVLSPRLARKQNYGVNIVQKLLSDHLLFTFVFFLAGCSATPSIYSGFIEDEEHTIKALAYFSQGLQDEQESNWQAAAVHFEKATTLSPHSPRAYSHLAWNLLHLDMNRVGIKALALAEKYAAFDDHMIYFDIGNVYRAIHDYRSASRCYRKSLEIFPHFRKSIQALAGLPKSLPKNNN